MLLTMCYYCSTLSKPLFAFCLTVSSVTALIWYQCNKKQLNPTLDQPACLQSNFKHWDGNAMHTKGVLAKTIRWGVVTWPNLGKYSKKKREKSDQADRLGRPPLPLPRSGQENVKNSRQVVIFGVILPFYNGQNGPKFSQNRSGQAGGRWPPPPQRGHPAPFFPVFFFDDFPKEIIAYDG